MDKWAQFQEGNYEKALQRFLAAAEVHGYQVGLSGSAFSA